MKTISEIEKKHQKMQSIGKWIRAILGPLALATLTSSMCAGFFMKAHWETAALEMPFTDGPLFPLFLFTLLIIVLLTLAFASLKTHAYSLRKQEKVTVEKSSFVRMASDTLRTPLTGLRWTTELMLEGQFGNMNDEQKESMNNMDDAIQRVIGLVNELLEVMRLSGGIIDYNAEPTDVALLIKGSVEDMRSIAGTKQLKIGFGQISHDVLIMMDSPLVRHVLSTLLTGSIHLADMNTVVVVHAEPSEDKIAIGITYKGEKIAFKNFDINEKSIQKSALPINLGDLDLAISWEILNAAEGEFWTVAKGTDHTLFIGLPLIAAPSGSEAVNKEVTPASSDVNLQKFLSDKPEQEVVETPTETAPQTPDTPLPPNSASEQSGEKQN